MSNMDPIVGFHFSIDVQDEIKGFFTEVSGLNSETEVIEHKIVTETGLEIHKKIPGRNKWENITLKRGITNEMDFWDWRQIVEDGDVEGARRSGSITMYNQQLKPVAQWDFERAWPVKITGPQPKSDSNSVSIEEIVLAHEGIKRVKV